MFSNVWLWAGIAAMVGTQVAFVHVPVDSRLLHAAPLDVGGWARVFAVGALLLVAVEFEKSVRRALGGCRTGRGARSPRGTVTG